MGWVGGLEVRGVCEGGRLKGEERERPGEMGGAGAGAGAGVWGAGWWWGWWIDSEASHILYAHRRKKIYQDDLLQNKQA